MNRRTFLAAAPAAVAIPPTAVFADPDGSPVMTLFRDWKAAFELVEAQTLSGISDAECAPFHAAEAELVRQIIQTPARDALDVCAKLTAYTCDGQCFADDGGMLSDAILREARMIVAKLRAG